MGVGATLVVAEAVAVGQHDSSSSLRALAVNRQNTTQLASVSAAFLCFTFKDSGGPNLSSFNRDEGREL